MNVVLFSSSVEGGAGGAAFRLHRGLRSIGVDSRLMVETPLPDEADDATTVLPRTRLSRALRLFRLNKLPLSLYRRRDREAPFSAQWMPDSAAGAATKLRPDVVNLHWVCGEFMRVESAAAMRAPIVWTLHDMWPFTGGCHHSPGCERYADRCGACPVLRSRFQVDASRWIWLRKARAWRKADLTIVTPSTWMAQCAAGSSLFRHLRIEVIPNGIDTQAFRPGNRLQAREALGLPPDRKVALYVAWRNRSLKGFDLLADALRRLSQCGWKESLELAVVGYLRPRDLPDTGVEARFLGRLSDSVSMRLAYAAADVYVAPSIHDNFPTTVLEAMACGTPCVAFNIGGMPDLIADGETGCLVTPFDAEEFARKVAHVLEDDARGRAMGESARQKVEQQYTVELFARRYRELFEDILEIRTAAGGSRLQAAAAPPEGR